MDKRGWAVVVTYEKEKDDPILDYACGTFTIWDVNTNIDLAKSHRSEIKNRIFEDIVELACKKFSGNLQCEEVDTLKQQYEFINNLFSKIKVELTEINVIL